LSSSTLHRPITTSPRNVLVRWLPTVVWLCLLAWFSSDVFSAHNTGGILHKIVQALFGEISRHNFEALHFFVRKTAHFAGYGFLSLLAFYAWKDTLPSFQPWTFRWSALALALALIAGGLDEFHQSFVSSRTSSPRDVVLDMAGALFFQIVIASFTSWSRERRARQPQAVA
jgi:VanZ family protein